MKQTHISEEEERYQIDKGVRQLLPLVEGDPYLPFVDLLACTIIWTHTIHGLVSSLL